MAHSKIYFQWSIQDHWKPSSGESDKLSMDALAEWLDSDSYCHETK